MSRRLDVPREIARQLEKHAMLPSGKLGLVAVSGGADSVALLLALHELGCRIRVAHLDHGLRADSPQDAEFVRSLCGQLSLECTVERRDVAAYRRQHKLSLEAAAREVRHAFLRELAEGHGAGGVFLAHTADDQVETFLLRLIRGAGVAGLSGMRAKRGALCRPMLGLWRTDVEASLRQRGQDWRDDASNRDPSFLRNRVRHELLPLLASMNPGIKQVLLREAQILGERQQELDAEVLRRLGLSARQIEAASAGKAVILKGGMRLEPVRAKPARTMPIDERLAIPGMVSLPGVGVIRAKGLPLPARQVSDDRHKLNVEYVDLESVGPELRVRTRRPGDRFVPLGMSEPKKLQDFLVDERLPREARDSLPLVTTPSGAIVWVVGMRIDDGFKLSPASSTAVRLEFLPQ